MKSTRLPPRSSRAAYFLRHVPPEPTPRGCLEWTGATHTQGYGVCWDADRRRPVYAHRLAYELAHGVTLTRADVIRHDCDNPACVNVEHLRPGTQADNMRDKAERGRAGTLRGTDSPVARLTDDDVRAMRARYATGETQAAIALRYGVSQPRVCAIINRRAWAHVR